MKLELLSPAGDWDCLRAAVANGADAVFLGATGFNARTRARNFPLEDLGRAIDFAHNHGVRVYLTMNTLVKNSEIEAFFNTLSRAYGFGIDGVIIQHISFLQIIKQSFPGLNVFISTQAAIGNSVSAALLKSADRVILPRELPLEEIRKIVSSGVRAEVFVHGALCFSYSGLCLFSSFVSDRSGNRGSCAQLCRQRYNDSYPLSTKELCTVNRIPELIQAGITGFKIEGRLRSHLYVAVATRLYRKAIDSFLAGKFQVPVKEMAEIEVVFNREFTEGLMFGETDLISPEKPMNRGALLGVLENGQIVLRRPVATGDGVAVWEGNSVTGAVIKEMTLAGKNVNSAAAGQKVGLDLSARDGARVYLTSDTSIDIAPDFAIQRPPIRQPKRKPVRTVLPRIQASARLQGLHAYASVGAGFPTRPGQVRDLPLQKCSQAQAARGDPSTNSVRAPGLMLLVKAYSVSEGEESLRAGADLVFYDIFSPDFPEATGSRESSRLGAYLPRIMDDEELSRALVLLGQKKPAAILTGNLGFLAWRAEFNVPVYTDYSMNTFNDLDTLFFRRYGATPILSPELSIDEMREIKDKDVVVFCHGDIILVNTLIALKEKRLIDEKGSNFAVRREDSYWQVLNSRPYGLFNDILTLRAMGFGQFFIDKQDKGAYLTELYRGILAGKPVDRKKRRGHTAGHLYRPVR